MRITAGTAAQRGRMPLALVLSGTVVSLLGSSLTVVALPWFVLQTTGSAARTGLAGFAVVLPNFLAGLLGGPIVDRVGFRRASVLADVMSAIGIGLIPTLFRTVGLPFWLLLILVFVGSSLAIPGLTARRAMLPELALAAHTRLERVNSAFEAIQFLAILLGPPLAGVLIVWYGASSVLWIDAATFVFSALAIGAAAPARARREAMGPASFLGELGAGLAFLRDDRLLRALAVSVGVANLMEAPISAIVLPVYAREMFGRPTDLGLLLAGFGGGALVGALSFGAVGYRLPRRVLWHGSLVLTPLLLIPAIAGLSLLPMIAALTAVGLVSGPLNPLLVTIRHERIPSELRGRVFSAFSAVSQLAAPLGMVAAGFAIQALGLRPTMILLVAAWELLALAMLFVPAFRELGTAPPTAGRRA